MKTLSLCSGIGGLDLGLERANFKIAAMCEVDAYCRSILSERWPGIPIYDGVESVEIVRGQYDCIAAGFPCQGLSVNGKQLGLKDSRSALWFDILRLVNVGRPTWCIFENSPMLLVKEDGDIVIHGLEAAGYSCWPLVVSAKNVGAPHVRRRAFVIAKLADPDDRRSGKDQQPAKLRAEGFVESPGDRGQAEASPRKEERLHRWPAPPGESQGRDEPPRAKPRLGGDAHGLSPRLESRIRKERLRSLGNAVVPQVAEAVGRAGMAVHGMERRR